MAAPLTAVPDLSARRGWRFAKSSIMTGLMFTAVGITLVPLVAVLWTVIAKGGQVISWDFLTEDIPVTSRTVGPGMGPAIVGTLIITAVATLLAVPLGILGAVYLNEYGGHRPLGRFIRFMTYVMTGVPSIVMGLFIYTIWVLTFKPSGFAGALALACLMLPVVIRSTEEMLRLVPDNLREASYALGTRKGRTIVTIVLPAAGPGILSGCLLAIARAAGETAPLVFTAGFATKLNTDIFNGPMAALAPQIFKNASSPYPGAQERAWGAALVLVAITFVFTMLARVVAARFSRSR